MATVGSFIGSVFAGVDGPRSDGHDLGYVRTPTGYLMVLHQATT